LGITHMIVFWSLKETGWWNLAIINFSSLKLKGIPRRTRYHHHCALLLNTILFGLLFVRFLLK